jgi:hypothetical protein
LLRLLNIDISLSLLCRSELLFIVGGCCSCFCGLFLKISSLPIDLLLSHIDVSASWDGLLLLGLRRELLYLILRHIHCSSHETSNRVGKGYDEGNQDQQDENTNLGKLGVRISTQVVEDHADHFSKQLIEGDL